MILRFFIVLIVSCLQVATVLAGQRSTTQRNAHCLPELVEASTQDYLEHKNDYHDFELAIHGDDDNLPAFFKETLSKRINKAYEWLSWFLPEQSPQKVKVNLWVFNDNHDYQQFKEVHVPHLSASSIGFHFSRKNIAAVWQKNDKQVLHTSVHEAVHVINARLFGYLPRWANEGIAEYIEDMLIQGQTAIVKPKKVWLDQVNKTPLNLDYLLSAGYVEWNGKNRRSLYAHSWALLYFLMSQSSSKMAFKAYLTEGLDTPCKRLDAMTYFSNHYPGGITSMQKNFTTWLTSNKADHHY